MRPSCTLRGKNVRLKTMNNFDENYEVVSLSAKVFKSIERDILGGKYDPGEALVETKLSAALGVSRTPIREAMRRLELEGLIKTIPNKGTIVVGFSRRDIEDIYMIRTEIDGLAARWAAVNATDAEIKKIGDIVALYEFYINRGGDLEKLVSLDDQFHDAVYSASHSRILNHTLPSLHRYLSKARERSLQSEERAAVVLEEHKRIFEEISARRVEEAEKAACEHISNGKNNFLKNMTGMFVED